MKILVTGAKGFIGKNLIATLQNIRDGKDKTTALSPDLTIYACDVDTPAAELNRFCQDCDFVFNLAGVNRPKEEVEFMQGNFGFASRLLDTLKRYKNTCPVMLSSSTQASLQNPYGESKKAGEDLFFCYAKETGAKVLVYRFPNVFGKWCRPNYNSAVATFCYNIARDLPITVNDRSHEMTLVYIDDVVDATILGIEKEEANGHVFNVGTGVPTDVLTVANTLIEKYGIQVPMNVSGNYRLGDIRHNYADITAARTILGFEPKWNFSDGIGEFVKWVNAQDVQEDKYEASIEEMKRKGLYK